MGPRQGRAHRVGGMACGDLARSAAVPQALDGDGLRGCRLRGARPGATGFVWALPRTSRIGVAVRQEAQPLQRLAVVDDAIAEMEGIVLIVVFSLRLNVFNFNARHHLTS